jgi:hypothetical protein
MGASSSPSGRDRETCRRSAQRPMLRLITHFAVVQTLTQSKRPVTT